MKKEKKAEIILNDGNCEEFSVLYYLLEDSAKGLYGVSVEKKSSFEHVEFEELETISDSREKALRILEYLAAYKVTPISFFDSIDGIIELEEEDSDRNL
ncbi:MAG: DUF6514 family protein [Anaerostipes sp.]|nr:DUF6514 family protein [Anaerostipes sp.]